MYDKLMTEARAAADLSRAAARLSAAAAKVAAQKEAKAARIKAEQPGSTDRTAENEALEAADRRMAKIDVAIHDLEAKTPKAKKTK